MVWPRPVPDQHRRLRCEHRDADSQEAQQLDRRKRPPHAMTVAATRGTHSALPAEPGQRLHDRLHMAGEGAHALAAIFRPVANPLFLLGAALPFLVIFSELWVGQYYPTVLILPFYAVSAAVLIGLLSTRPIVE